MCFGQKTLSGSGVGGSHEKNKKTTIIAALIAALLVTGCKKTEPAAESIAAKPVAAMERQTDESGKPILTFVSLNSPPAETIDENGNPSGINVDLVSEAFNRMGYTYKFSFVPWKRAVHMVKVGKADALVDAAKNPEREEFLFYPDEEIYVEKWYAFKNKKTRFTLNKGLTNANEISFGICRGFEYGGIVQEAINNKRFKRIDIVANNENNIKKLVGNRFDMLVGVKLTIFDLSKKLGLEDRIEIVTMTETGRDYLLSSSKTYLAFSKKRVSKKLVKKFSDTIAQMKKDGTFNRISRKAYY
ncbi:MAG: transporter substrate-binding domain-containing protein [bacterium]|nr:transporter substrate-binding domain-containing protein [bacterium]